MTDEFDPSVRDEATAGAAASVPLPLSTDAVAAGRRSPLTVDAAARQAGCTPAYLSECIACGQLAASGSGTVDVEALTAWIERSLRPQQRALRAVVDAIDTMELRSLKPLP